MAGMQQEYKLVICPKYGYEYQVYLHPEWDEPPFPWKCDRQQQRSQSQAWAQWAHRRHVQAGKAHRSQLTHRRPLACSKPKVWKPGPVDWEDWYAKEAQASCLGHQYQNHTSILYLSPIEWAQMKREYPDWQKKFLPGPTLIRDPQWGQERVHYVPKRERAKVRKYKDR